MNRTNLTAGVMTSVLCINGRCYLAYAVEGHWLIAFSWLENLGIGSRVVELVDANCLTHGFPVLSSVNSIPTILYRVDRPEEGVVGRQLLPDAPRSPWLISTEGIWPACWGPAGLMGVNQKHPYWIVSSNWPDTPVNGPLSRSGAPTGISRFDGSVPKWVLWDEDNIGRNKRYTSDGKAAVGVTFDDKVFAEIDGQMGILLEGENYRWPSIARQSNGKLLIACHVENSNEALEKIVVLENVSVEDLKPIVPPEDFPPLDAVPILNREFGLVFYCYNDVQSPGNMTLMIRPKVMHSGPETQFIATTDDDHLIHDDKLWAIYSGEASGVPAETAIKQAREVGKRRKRGLSIYQDSYPMRDSVMDLSEDKDILTPQVFRNENEPLDSYRSRLRKQFIDCSIVRETWETVNIHRRYADNGTPQGRPTLSKSEVCWGVVTAMQVWAEMGANGGILFRAGTSDVPDEVWKYIEKFRSGITGVPAARVLEDPEPPPDPKPEPDEVIVMNVYRYPEDTQKPDKTDGPIPYYKISEKNLVGKRVPSPRPDVAALGGFGIVKSNGKLASLNPDGNWEERDNLPENIRSWETFFDANPGMSAPREKSPGVVVSFWFRTIMGE